jgi:hypothetical protein
MNTHTFGTHSTSRRIGRRGSSAVIAVVLAAATFVLTACGSAPSAPSAGPPNSSASAPANDLDLVDLDRGQDPVSALALGHAARDALQRQPGGEDALDHVVVQVRRDAVAFVEHRGALLLGTRFTQLDGDRGLVGEPGGHVEVLGGEGGSAPQSSRGEHTVHPLRSPQRYHQDRADLQSLRGGDVETAPSSG